ncbi:hypothetical protein [Lysobacter fragariae]
MSQDLVSMVVTPEQQAAALAGIAQIRAALPGLISLAPEDRRGIQYMGSKAEVFARQTVRVLKQNLQIVPPSLGLDAADGDLAALDQLRPVLEQLQQLFSQLDDTVSALGSDVMDVAMEGYGQLKLSGAAHGLEDMRKELGSRWARQRRQVAPAAG